MIGLPPQTRVNGVGKQQPQAEQKTASDCQKGEKILRAIILKASLHHIPSGRHRINTEPVPTEILEKMRARDDL